MLVLSRRSRESVVIGGDDGIHRLLKVTVLGVQGAKVKLGFEVDADVPVHRLEVWERIKAEGQLLGESNARERKQAREADARGAKGARA